MINEHRFTVHGWPQHATVHFHVCDCGHSEIIQRLAEINSKLDLLMDSVGDKEKLIALGKELDAKRAEWGKAIEPAKPE